jgi:hypothetical protein
MERYAQLAGNTIKLVIESAVDPDGVNGEWVLCGNAGPGWTSTDGGLTFSPPAPTVPPAPEWEWYINLGPFYDRFGPAKMAVLTSTDPMVVAIRADVAVRAWVDLKRADVAQSLGYIASVVPALTPAIITAILTTPVALAENLALRKDYFS